MNINFKFLLLGTTLSLIPNVLYAQCAETDCLKLGYTSLQKCDNGLKCPFGEYWACPKVEEKAVLGECTGYAKNCKIGQILNSDGTCTTDKETGKEPIGVVVYISDNNCGYAMTSPYIAKSTGWADNAYGRDIPSLPNYTNWQEAIKDFDSCENTKKIIQSGNSDDFPAAWVVVNYAPDAALETKGKWCLPAAGIWNSVFTNLDIITNTMIKINKSDTELYRVWSSTESSGTTAWIFDKNYPEQGGILNYGNKAGALFVRPVIEF